MTISELIANFRAGLLRLIPCIEKIGIPWKRPEAYDEWDNLASAVFETLVVEPLRSSMPANKQSRFGLPKYDMLLASYSGMSVIELLPATSDGQICVFHALGTKESPLDIVEWREIDVDGKPISDNLQTSLFVDSNFAIKFYSDGYLNSRSIVEVDVPSL